MFLRLALPLVATVAPGLFSTSVLTAQAPDSSPDRWQLTLNDQSYVWNVRLVRLSGDTLIVRSRDSLVSLPIRDIKEIQLLGETILRVQDGHRSGIGALGDNNSPIVDLASLALTARRERLQALVDHEASPR